MKNGSRNAPINTQSCKKMTEKEILEHQQQTDNTEFYLMLVGKFLHAYGHGAFALSRGTGYRVMRKARKDGEIITSGFPVDRLESVRDRLRDAGGYIEQINDKLYRFGGIDGTPDDNMVEASAPSVKNSNATPGPIPERGGEWLREAVIGYNLSMSTPMDAMNFIAKLQQQIKEDIAEKVQGADCPKGKAPGIACESPSGQGSTE